MQGSGIEADAYAQTVERWRRARLEALTAPDGWLTLTGLLWLQPGTNTLGQAGDNTVVLGDGPARLGVIDLAPDGTLALTVAPAADVHVDGRQVHAAVLVDDAHAGAGKPTEVAFGASSFHVVERDGRKALRVRSAQATTRTGFLGLDYFAIDPAWRVVADWVPAPAGTTLEMGTVIGTVEKYPVPGAARFARDGETFELLPVLEEPDAARYFLVFADRTSGKETYGAARFLYVDPPVDGKVVLDFNRAYNPPCAFTAFATCPLAPPENRLALRVTAGEKKYRGSPH